MVAQSQLKLYPEVGIAFNQSIMTESNPNMKAGRNVFGNYAGFGAYKVISEKSSIHFNFSGSVTWLYARYSSYPQNINPKFSFNDLFWDKKGLIEANGVNLYNFCLSYHYSVIKFRLTTHEKAIVKECKYLSIEPFCGIGINKIRQHNIPANLKFADSSSSTSITDSNEIGSTAFLGYSDFEYYGIGKNKIFGDKFVRNYWGLSLQWGVVVQFKKENKDRLAIRFRYNIGLTTLLYSPFHKPSNYSGIDPNYYKGAFASKGSFWSISLSYPITILNKKGERYRNRHPKT
jgi:hypothetical protein